MGVIAYVRSMHVIAMTREQRRETLLQLDKEQLVEIILDLQDQFGGLQQRVASVEQTIAQRDEAPSFVKPNTAPRAEKTRKKRAHGAARRRETPTRIEQHAADRCPDCGFQLTGGWVHSSRQVIQVPQVSAEVVEHQLLRRRCGACGKSCLPHVDLSEVAIGKRRFGISVMALVTHLRTACRVPVHQISSLLQKLYHLRVSEGEIVELLHATAQKGQAFYEQIRDRVRASHHVTADETSWREDGRNGYVWSFSTDQERFFTIEASRGSAVAKQVLGEEFNGVLSSDFYSGYHFYDGQHQRCWAHLLRDLNDLGHAYAHEPHVNDWKDAVCQVYREAAEFASAQKQEEDRWASGDAHPVTKKARRDRLQAERIAKRNELNQRLHVLALPWSGVDAPQRLLAERIERHLPELFAFVEHRDVEPTNNRAERAIRSCVIRRKVSGGTRSPAGSHTLSVLMTLCDTWAAQAQNSLAACQDMLAGRTKPIPARA